MIPIPNGNLEGSARIQMVAVMVVAYPISMTMEPCQQYAIGVRMKHFVSPLVIQDNVGNQVHVVI